MVRTVNQCACCRSRDPTIRCRPCNDDLPSTFTFSVLFETTDIPGPTSNRSLCPGAPGIGWNEPERSAVCDAMSGTYSLSRVPGVFRCGTSNAAFRPFGYIDSIFWRGGIVNIEYPDDQRDQSTFNCNVPPGLPEVVVADSRIPTFEWIFRIFDPHVDPPACSYALSLVPKYIADNVFTIRPPSLSIPHPLCQTLWQTAEGCYDNYYPFHDCLAGINMSRHTYTGSSNTRRNSPKCKQIFLQFGGGGYLNRHRSGPVCQLPLQFLPDGSYYLIELRGN